MLISRSTIVTHTTGRTATAILFTCCCKRQRSFLHSGITNRRQLKDTEKPSEYNLNVGYAIATLQDDLPHFFKNGLTEHSIYSPDIVLSDPHYTKFSVHGRTAYLGIAQMLRWSTSLYFDNIAIEITKMRAIPENEDIENDDYLNGNSSSSNDSDLMNGNNNVLKATSSAASLIRVPSKHTLLTSTIEQAERDLLSKGTIKRLEVRWKMQGVKNATFFNPQPRIRYIEGIFVYTFDDVGLIGEHRIQRIVPPPSRRVLWLHSWGVRLRSLFWEKRAPVLNPGF